MLSIDTTQSICTAEEEDCVVSTTPFSSSVADEFLDDTESILLSTSTEKSTISNSKPTMSLTKPCCTLPAVESDYVATGKEVQLGDMIIYETGDATSKRLLISVYDIFGFHPNSKQLCDKIGQTGFRVIMPDFFRGSPWNSNNFPPAK